MPPSDRDKLRRIEELKDKLFTRGYRTKIEHRDAFTRTERSKVPDTWESAETSWDPVREQEKFFMRTSVFKNFFIFSLVFFGLTVLYASYVFFAGGNTVSPDNIDISVLGNNFAAGGEELPLVIGIANRNASALELVDLVIEYPKDSADPETGLPSSTERLRESLGTIPAGGVRNENVKLVLYGEQGSLRPIQISVEYRVEGSNGIFVKKKVYEVALSSTPLNLSIDAPEEISSNEDFTLNVKATLNATRPAGKVLLRLDYPVGFKFSKATPAPTSGNNVWNLGDLAPGAERKIAITGRMLDAADGEEKVFHLRSGSQSTEDKSAIGVVFSSAAHAILIKKPFIEAELFVNGISGSEYAVGARAPVRGEIRWTNNLDTKISDLVIQAKITGNALDRRTVSAERGFYNSLTDTITWDKNSQSELGEVSPGDSGSVGFSFSSVSLFSAERGALPEPSIAVNVSISGKQSVAGYATRDLKNSDSSVVRIISDVGFAARASYYSAPANTGPIPPKVGLETSYTIIWSLSNTANPISRAVARSSLPAWMRFGAIVSSGSENLAYNPSTREIIWNIGNLPKGAGITLLARTVSFKVIFTPSLSQVGTTPVIINDAVLTGRDDFAKVEIRASKPPLRTQLDSDPGFPAGGGTVVE